MNNKTDKLTIRMIAIITKLNLGEQLTPKELAEEFCVSERIIQKDLNERLNQFLPIVKRDGRYFLEDFLIGKLDYDDIKTFAQLSGIEKLYPSLEPTFLSDVFNKKINDACLVKGGKYEDISDKRIMFDTLRLAITLKHQISFIYKDKQRVVNPYKLVNTHDIWYLVGDEDGTLKNFAFTKIKELHNTTKKFHPKQELIEIINKNEVDWFSQVSIKVILEIDAGVKEYFLRRELLPNQTILKETNKRLVLQTKVSYEEEILQVVRYWIPHIKIIEPIELQEKLHNQLNSYLKT